MIVAALLVGLASALVVRNSGRRARSNSLEDNSAIDNVQFVDSTLVSLPADNGGNGNWSDCSVGPSWFNVTRFAVLPANIKHGQFARVVFEAQWSNVINGGALNFTMDFNGHNFRHAVHDLCHILQIMHRFDPGVTPCPVPAQPGGFKFKSAPIFVPPTVPVGVYAAHLEVADENGATFLCVNYDLTISA